MNHSRRELMKTIAVAAALAASGASAAEKKREMETMPTVHDAAADDSLPDRHVITVPTVDISGATNAGDFKRHVVLASGADGAVALAVADDGPGIREDVRAQIFDVFFTTRKNGTGLGLNIVSRIVEEHRGTLTVESAPGRGAVFRIELPAAPACAEERA